MTTRVCEVTDCPCLTTALRCDAHRVPNPAAERELRRRAKRLRKADGRVLRLRRQLEDAEREMADARVHCAEMWGGVE